MSYCIEVNCSGELPKLTAGFTGSSNNLSFGKYWDFGVPCSFSITVPIRLIQSMIILKRQNVGRWLLDSLTHPLCLMMGKFRLLVVKWRVQSHRGRQEQKWGYNPGLLMVGSNPHGGYGHGGLCHGLVKTKYLEGLLPWAPQLALLWVALSHWYCLYLLVPQPLLRSSFFFPGTSSLRGRMDLSRQK